MPVTTPFQDDLYWELGAWRAADQSGDLLNYVGAIASMFDQIELYARDGADGEPGWSIILDIDRCPPEAFAFLGMIVGVTLQDGLSDDEQRERIRSTDGFNRGTPRAMIAAAQQYLEGSKTVYFNERAGGAYQLSVSTLVSETPDEDRVRQALIDQKPAGIILTYDTIEGGDYETLKLTHTDYTDVAGTFATYDDLRADPSIT